MPTKYKWPFIEVNDHIINLSRVVYLRFSDGGNTVYVYCENYRHLGPLMFIGPDAMEFISWWNMYSQGIQNPTPGTTVNVPDGY